MSLITFYFIYQANNFRADVHGSILSAPNAGVKANDLMGVFKRGEAPLYKILPLPLIKGKGIKGIGLPNKNLIALVAHQCYTLTYITG